MKILPSSIFHFLFQINFKNKINEIRNNTRNFDSFQVRFFRWFNAFMVMKFVHFARDAYYPNIAVAEVARELLEKLGIEVKDRISAKELLLIYRQMARK